MVPLQLVLALAMAMMLRHIGRGRDLMLWIWSIPLGISDLAAGLVWLAILTEQGYLNTVLFQLGVIHRPQSWLTYETPLALFLAILVAEIWRATAIVAGHPGGRRAAHAAGIRRGRRRVRRHAWQRFSRVTLPLLRPSIQTALILRTVLAFEMFAVVLALGGQNFPVLISQAYQLAGHQPGLWRGRRLCGAGDADLPGRDAGLLIALRPRPGEIAAASAGERAGEGG